MPTAKTTKKFLIATWEGGGSVGPKLTVARKLLQAGHDVRVMSDACNAPEAEAVGARFVPWTRAPSRKDRSKESELIRDWAAANPVEGFMQAIDDVFAGPALAYAEDLIEELAKEPADLVISSDLLLGVMAGCEAADQDLVVLPCNWLFYPLDDAPRCFPAHRANPTEQEQAEWEAMRTGMKAMFDHGLPALNAARAKLGLRPLATVLDQVAVARKVLIGISRTFDFGDDSSTPRFRYVGPQLDDPAWAEGWTSPWPIDDGRPFVLVSFSTTFQNHAAVLQRVVDALAQLPVNGVVTLGPTIDPAELSPSANIQLVRSAPHNLVMQQADLVVTHGGHGTVARAMVNQLPMLVLPHGRDQDGNAARIVEHGSGLTLPPSAATEEIRAAIARLLDEPSYRSAARRLGEAVQRDMAEGHVVEELEALCCPAFA